MGTIAQLGPLTPTFMLILSAPLIPCSNLATLARVAKLVAIEVSHRVRNKQGQLHLGLSDRNLLGHFWRVESQKQSVDGDLFSIPLHRHSVDLYNTLFLQFLLDLRFHHSGEFMAADNAK